MLLAVCHSSETGWNEVYDLDRLSDLNEQAGNLLWAEADVAHLDQSDIETIAEEFGLNPLAVEDAAAPRQRPKLEAYEQHLFVVMHELNEVEDQLEPTQLACFVGPRYVLTIHHGATRTITEAKRRWSADTALADGPTELLHTLLDVIVDDLQAHANRLELEIEQLEDIALSAAAQPVQRQVYSVKQQVARMRRFAAPVESILVDLFRSGDRIPPNLIDLFRDVQDHVVRMNEQIHNVSELSDAVIDFVRSEHAEAFNKTSQKLAAWAAIFGVSTIVAGVYGMNYELVPHNGTNGGFWFAIGLMIVLAAALFAYFKRKGWL